jgi:hypothetical protein
MHPLTLRFIIAGIVVAAGGIAIAVTGAGVGEGAVWKGSVIAIAGAGLIVSSILRQFRPPGE